MLITELTVAVELGAHLDRLAIAWVIGGSVASSLLSIPFNVMHLESMTKVDVFCCPDDPLSRAQLDRRQMVAHRGAAIPILTPEDIILQKLRGYVDGGEVSDRQWQDALGVARFHRGSLDLGYLDRQARGAGLDALLARLLEPAPDQG